MALQMDDWCCWSGACGRSIYSQIRHCHGVICYVLSCRLLLLQRRPRTTGIIYLLGSFNEELLKRLLIYNNHPRIAVFISAINTFVEQRSFGCLSLYAFFVYLSNLTAVVNGMTVEINRRLCLYATWWSCHTRWKWCPFCETSLACSAAQRRRLYWPTVDNMKRRLKCYSLSPTASVICNAICLDT